MNQMLLKYVDNNDINLYKFKEKNTTIKLTHKNLL